ncbi:MAG: energy transducer TonB [Bacteroides sp.]|nr:energy transducer TonB [Bacteroides sp.]
MKKRAHSLYYRMLPMLAHLWNNKCLRKLTFIPIGLLLLFANLTDAVAQQRTVPSSEHHPTDSLKPVVTLPGSSIEEEEEYRIPIPDYSADDCIVELEYEEQDILCPVEESLPEEQEEEGEPVYIEVEQMPKLTENHILIYTDRDPCYPPEILKEGIEGKVVIRCVIEKDGSVTTPVIMRGIDPVLDSTAVKIVQQFPRFEPGMEKGEPVRVQYILPITFKINKDRVDP